MTHSLTMTNWKHLGTDTFFVQFCAENFFLFLLPLHAFFAVWDVNVVPLADIILYLVVCRGQKLALNRHIVVMVFKFLCRTLPWKFEFQKALFCCNVFVLSLRALAQIVFPVPFILTVRKTRTTDVYVVHCVIAVLSQGRTFHCLHAVKTKNM